MVTSAATNLLPSKMRTALHQVFVKCKKCNKLEATWTFIVSKWMESVFRTERAAVSK